MKGEMSIYRPVYMYFLFNTLIIVGGSYVVLRGNEILQLFGGIVFYFFIVAIVLSPVGEWLIRRSLNGEKIEETPYAKRITDLFQEVAGRFELKHKKLGRGMKLFLCKGDMPNAFIVGRKTICLTEGMMKLSNRKIKGTIAHELGHIFYQDTLFLTMIQLGNPIAGILLMVGGYLQGSNLIGLMCFMIFLCIWTKCGIMLIVHASRENEVRVDMFAADLGYADELCEMLQYALAEIKKSL